MGGCAASTPSPSTASNEAAPVTVVDLDAGKAEKPVAKADPKMASKKALQEAAAKAGILGLLQAGDQGALSSSLTAEGSMWGDSVGDAFATGGLGLSGIDGSGRGSRGGIGLGSIGTIGHGGGGGTAQGYGTSVGRLSGAGTSRPKVRAGATDVKGKLPPEVIRRVVRQHLARFRYCYEKGLKTDPNLAGKVVARFNIKADGSVGAVSDGGSTLSDASVKSCLLLVFQGMKFPAPEGGGMVTVSYPLVFSPGDTPPAPPQAPPPPPSAKAAPPKAPPAPPPAKAAPPKAPPAPPPAKAP